MSQPHMPYGTGQPGQSSQLDPSSPAFVFPGTENINPATVFSRRGYNAPQHNSNSSATAGLWLAAISMLIHPLTVVALVVSIVGLVQSSSRGGRGRHEATAGIVVSGVVIVSVLFFFGVIYLGLTFTV